MRILTSLSLLYLFLGFFQSSLAVDGVAKKELEEDSTFWSRALTMSMSMSMTLGDESYGYSVGQCGRHCTRNKDCQKGGYNPCLMCGKYVGTQYYHLCYDPSQYSPTPSPTTHNYFPDAGMCRKKCKKNADCRKGGFNPCGECGTYEGTIMHGLCYSPDN